MDQRKLMNVPKIGVIYTVICIFALSPSKTKASTDSLILAQCYANLSLTVTYFDTLPKQRLAKIIPYLAGELDNIKDKEFINSNNDLYFAAKARLYFLKAKFMFKNKTSVNRAFLLQCKTVFDSVVFNLRKSNNPLNDYGNTEYYKFAGFNTATSEAFSSSVSDLKNTLTLNFNKDIYPDFQRLFYAARNKNRLYLDSLQYYAGLYGIAVNFNIKNNSKLFDNSSTYWLALPLDLISQYLQFRSILKEPSVKYEPCIVTEQYSQFLHLLNPTNDTAFGIYSTMPKDNFFRKELNLKVCDELGEKLHERFKCVEYGASADSDGDGISAGFEKDLYYFPIPAPFPSCKYAINHFAPAAKTLKEADNYIRKNFHAAGYEGRLHYFYIKYPGFAVVTDIERINKDGSPTSEASRWNLKMSNNGNFTLYEIFKSIFFATESDFRLIACIVASREIETVSSSKKTTAASMHSLIKNSYSSLPVDLENVSLPDKTLTILVYHFNQSDIGEVPVLSSSNKLIVSQHFKKTQPLERLIK